MRVTKGNIRENHMGIPKIKHQLDPSKGPLQSVLIDLRDHINTHLNDTHNTKNFHNKIRASKIVISKYQRVLKPS